MRGPPLGGRNSPVGARIGTLKWYAQRLSALCQSIQSGGANPAKWAFPVKYPGAVTEAVRTPQVVIDDAEIFEAHEGGKLSVELKAPLDTQRALSIAYTPGVAQVSRAIATDHTLAKKYTWANRLVAVISDGTAVLGLGDIGPAASLPVMEGKSALFKTFGGLNSIPIVLDTKDPDEIVETIIRLRPTFGAVNLEDISAPRCFEIERRVIEALDCPVMHDDQHGTAIVVLAALLGATKVLDRDMHTLKVVISGAGAAGIACANILLAKGIADITVLDSQGILHAGRDDMNPFKEELATRTNPRGLTGGIAEALDGVDVFMGVSAGLVPEELIATMAPGGIVFAMSNPDPEIHPDAARKYAAVVATGRSDFPNQINNVLAFPGVFRGALDAGARRITEKMKVAAAEAIFSVVGDDLAVDHIVPSALDPRVGPAVAAAVAAASKA
jgi:malate dehydrogenase (oxaloacetate-decarboxylating)